MGGVLDSSGIYSMPTLPATPEKARLWEAQEGEERKNGSSTPPSRIGSVPMLAHASAVPISVNFRDLATVSKQLRPGVLFRSSQVISGKEMRRHQIKTFLDLRMAPVPCKASLKNTAQLMDYYTHPPFSKTQTFLDLRMAPVLCKASLKNTAQLTDYYAHNTRHAFTRAIKCGRHHHEDDAEHNYALACQRCGAASDTTYGIHADVYHVDLLPLVVQLLIMWQLPATLKLQVVSAALRKREPDRLVAGAVADPKVVGYAKLYKFMLDHARPQIARALRLCATRSRVGALPMLVHCIHGKDRTGIIVALILKLCGVSDEAIVRDYALSELRLREGRDASALLLLGDHLTTDEVIAATAEVMVSALDHIRRKYGSVQNYVLDVLYLTHEEIDDIRTAMLRPQARERVETAERLGGPLDSDPSQDLAGFDDQGDPVSKSVRLEHVSIAVAAVSRRLELKRGQDPSSTQQQQQQQQRDFHPTLERVSSATI